jgi:GntR family transcriptional regulator, carbon starvation induced regulator
MPGAPAGIQHRATMAKSSEAYERLKSDILRAVIVPDTPLVVAGLKERYGLGWTPLREALSRLEIEGLVILEHNRGYRVAPVSAGAIRDLQLARRTVEETLLRRSIESGDANWEAGIVAEHHRLSRTPSPAPGINEAGMALWEERHDAFHRALLAAGRSESLTRFQRQITEQLQRHHRHMLFDPAARQELDPLAQPSFGELVERTLGLAHHTELMEATLARDTDRAVALLVEHIGFSLAVYAFLWPLEA